MIARNEILSPRVELTGSQRSLLEERLQRARQMAGSAPEPKPSIPRRTTKEPVPLSFAQERLWFLDQLEPDSPVYNLCQGGRLRGTLDVGALEKSLNEIIARHEVLRTNFVAMDGNPVQVIAPERSLVLNVVDLTGRDPNVIAEELARRLADESRRPFDLSRDVLLRALLVRTQPAEHTLLLTMHHIISDGWSVGVFFRELETLYAGHVSGTPVTLPELPLQFADFVLWDRQNLRGATLDKLVAYWKKQFGGSLPVLELPTDRPRAAAMASRGAALTVQLPRTLTVSLTSLSQREGATLFMTLLAAFQVLLYRWSEQEDIVVGSVVAGRRKVELEKLIGFFVNTLVLRGDLSGRPTFRQLLGRARETVLGALAHQELPFEELVKALRPDRTLSRNPLFQVMFILQNQPMTTSQLPGLTLEPLEVDTGTAKFDLTLAMMDTPAGLVAGLEYNAELFEAATMWRFLSCFQTLLENIVANPDQRVADLELLSASERHQLIVTWNDTRRPYPANRCLHELFAEQVAKTPTALAVVGEGGTLTYAELAEQAGQVAHRLRAAGIGPGSLVGIFLSRTPRLLVGLLGVLKAGGAYVPLDPAYPPDRLNYIVGHAGITALVTENSLAEKAPTTDAEIVRLDEILVPESPAADAPAAVSPSDLAYVIYTSGSTGRPKGVAIEHRSVVALVSWARDVYTPAELAGTLASTSACFDVSVFEMFVPLCCGGSVIMAENILQLPALDTSQEITLISSVPSAIAELVRMDTIPASVRTVNTAGEPCPQSLVEALYRQPHIQRVLDLYGPTETTVYSTYSVRQPGAIATIGRPLANEQVYILDRSMQPVPIGVAGELYIGGDGLARGYLHQAELTSERFVADPFHAGQRLYRTGDRVRYRDDGNIEFLGRLDHQIKLRGYRIELEEIEAVLLRHRSVRECAARVRLEPPQDPRLFAYVVPAPGAAIDVRELRQHLQERLPDYMVPTAIVELAKLPVTPNGKLDVKALPATAGEHPDGRAQYVAPSDDVEQQLVAIWEDVLGVSPIGTHDRFFDLGGHSLLAVRMVAQLEKKFGRKLPVAAVFQHRTVEELAPLLRSDGQRYASASSIVEIQGHGHRAPLYFVHGIGGGMFWGYANLARHLSTEQPVYAFKSRGLDDLPEWPTIELMAANYVADLRARQPQGPYYLGGYCFGGTVAFEMARQLHAQNQHVELLALINCSPPNTGYFRSPNRRSLRWQIKFLRNLFYWGGCFAFRWSLRERLDFVRWKLRVLRRKASEPAAQDAKEIAVNDIDELLNLADYSERQRQVWQHHVRCLFEYHPQPYAGRVTLFRTGGHPLLSSFDDQFGWGELAKGGVEVRLMPGGHGNILDEPHVRAVAQSLQSCLRNVVT